MPLIPNRKTPIVAQTETAQQNQLQTIDITSNTNTSIIVNNNKQNLFSLITNVAGSSWIVDYYSQVLTRDSQLSGQQESVSPTAQQYQKIKLLELKVSTPLTYSQDDVNKQSNATGEAILYPVIIPNDGDMFIADIGESRYGIFKITRTVKLSLFNNACYQISYILIKSNYNVDNEESLEYKSEYEDLEQKTVKTLYFNKNNIVYNDSPLVIESDFKLSLELEKKYNLLLDYYFDTFYSRRLRTLILPGQTSNFIYDIFLMKFIKDNFCSSEHINILDLVHYNATLDEELKSVSVLDAITKKDINILNRSFKKYRLCSSKNLSNIILHNNVKYSDINLLIYPKDPNIFLDNTIKSHTNLFSDYNLIEEDIENDFILPENIVEIPNNPDLINIPKITIDDYYIFSENFYTNNPVMSVVESLILSYIKNETIDKKYLYNISLLYPNWSLLVQFYYLPIILSIIKFNLKIKS